MKPTTTVRIAAAVMSVTITTIALIAAAALDPFQGKSSTPSQVTVASSGQHGV